MKKKQLWKFIALFLLMGLMGCKSNTDEDPSAMEGHENRDREDLTLWSYYETKAQREGLDKLVREYNESQEKYTLSWEYVPMADFVRNLSFAQSDDHMPDMVLVDNPDMVSLVKIGLLADITEQLKEIISGEEYYTEILKFAEYDGYRYGIPFCCNNTAIIYNKKMFQEKGLKTPETWEEFKDVAAVLTEEGNRYGFAMSAVSGEQGAFQFMSWMLAAGADTKNMADDKLIEAFYMINDLIQTNCMPNDCMNWSQNDLATSFVEGKIAMMENGPWSLAALEEAGIDYGIFKFPGKTSTGVVLGGEVLAAVDGMNVDGVISFINYYNKKDVMEDICQITKNIPPKIELAESYGEKNPESQVFVEQMENGIGRKSIKNWKKVCNALSDSLNKLFGSEEDVDEIWKEYVESIEED